MSDHLILLATEGSKRVRLMQAARAQLGLPPAHVLAWRDYLRQPALLPALLDTAIVQPCAFKIEPPGDDPAAHWHLLAKGRRLQGRATLAAPAHGQLLAMDAWFAGFEAAMRTVADQLAQLPRLRIFNPPVDILRMTDKLACQQHLAAQGVAVPVLLGPVAGYDHLQSLLDQHGCERVYLKPRYGSSASGVVAYRRHRDGRAQATSSARLVQKDGVPLLFNDKRFSRLHATADIAALIDALAQQQLYAEAWLPKPRFGNSHYDLRVVTIAGQPAHRVARIGAQMMTNLHLDNQRGDAASLLDAADTAAMEAAARQAASTFPDSHVTGYDLVVRHGRAHVLEANAFGDLLPGLLWQGQDTYSGQLHHA